MKQSKYLLTGDDISTMGLTPLPGKSQLSGKTVLTKKDIVDNYYASVSDITEDNRCVTFERVTSSVYLTLSKSTVSLTAAGGSDTVTIDTNLDSSLISLNTVSGFTVSRNGKTITITASNLGTTTTSQKTATLTVTGGGKSTSCTLTQQANTATYGEVTISGGTVSDISAAGGSISTASGLTSSQKVTFTSGASRAGSITTSYSTAVSASSLGTTIKNRTSVGTLTATCKGEGSKSATKQFTVYQAGNYITKIELSGGSLSYPTIEAGATSATPSVSSMLGTYSYTSGSTTALAPVATYGTATFEASYSLGSLINGFTAINSSSGVLTTTNRGSTPGDARTSGIVTRNVKVTWTPTAEYNAGGTITGTGKLTATCTQKANTLTWATPIISRTTPVSIAAAGGTNNVATGLTYSQTGTYSSGSTTTASSGGTLSYAVQTAKTGFSLSGSTVTVTNNTSTSARNGFVVRVTLTLNGKTATKDITYNQSAGYYTYANPVVTVKCNDVPASGGSVTSGTATYSQTYGWNGATSGVGTVTSGGNVSWSGGASNIASLGTTTKSRSIVGNKLTATVTLNGKTGTGSADVYQAANTKNQTGIEIEKACPDPSWVAIESWDNVPAWNAFLAIQGYRKFSFSSGSTSREAIQRTPAIPEIVVNLSEDWTEEYDSVYCQSVKVLSRDTTVGDARTGTVSWTYEGFTSNSLSFTQMANSKTYGAITIPSYTYPAVAAGGGTSTPSVGTITQATSFTSGATSSETITSGKSYSIPTAVSGASINSTSGVITWTNNTNTSSRSVTARLTVTANGKSATKDASCSQNAGVKTYSPVTVSLSYPTIGAAGGTVNPTVTYSQTWGWNGSTTGGGTITSGGTITYSGTSVNTTNGSVSASSKGTTVSDITTVTTATAKVTLNGKEGSAQFAVKQAANAATTITYGTPVVNFTVADIPAGGGTVKSGNVTYSQSRTQNYTSGATSALSALTTGGTITYNPSAGITAPSLGATVKSRTEIGTLTATVTMNGKSGSKAATVYQQANNATYGALTGGSVTASDIPASGGTRTATVTNMTQTVTFTSGTSRAGTVSNSQTSAISGSNLGTTVKSRTKLGTITVTFTGEGSKTATKTVDVYQEANTVINSNYNPHITAYGTPSISIGSGITAAGGSATVSHSVSNTETYYDYYTSGTAGPAKTRSVTGSTTISITSNGNSRFSLSGNTVSHSSMTTNAVTDTVTVTAKNAGDSTKTKSASISVTNNRKVQGTSGGVVTYENVTAGAITNKTIPASGGSATATAGNGSQKWSKTAVTTTYVYDSGSTKNETTTAATSGTDSISPSVSSITASAGSKGTTVSSQNTVKSQAVTWTGQGNKSASGTMYIYQAANSLDAKQIEFSDLNDTYDKKYNDVYWYITSECNLVSKYSSGASTSIAIGEPGASAYPLRYKIELTSTSDSSISTNGTTEISFSFPNQSTSSARTATARITAYFDPNTEGAVSAVRTVTITQGTKPAVQLTTVYVYNQTGGTIKITPTGGTPITIYSLGEGSFSYGVDEAIGSEVIVVDYQSGQNTNCTFYGGGTIPLLSPGDISGRMAYYYPTNDFKLYVTTMGSVTLKP